MKRNTRRAGKAFLKDDGAASAVWSAPRALRVTVGFPANTTMLWDRLSVWLMGWRDVHALKLGLVLEDLMEPDGVARPEVGAQLRNDKIQVRGMKNKPDGAEIDVRSPLARDDGRSGRIAAGGIQSVRG